MKCLDLPCHFPAFPLFSHRPSGQEKVAKVETDIITIRELAAYLKMAEKTLYRLTAEGSIPGFKVGGSWRFRKAEIDKWIRKQSSDAKG